EPYLEGARLVRHLRRPRGLPCVVVHGTAQRAARPPARTPRDRRRGRLLAPRHALREPRIAPLRGRGRLDGAHLHERLAELHRPREAVDRHVTRRPRPAHLVEPSLRHTPDPDETNRDGGRVQDSGEPCSGRFLIPSRVDHFDQLSFIASISSRMKRGDMLMRLTTTPGTSPSSTSWSMRANVSVNS